MYVHHRFWQQRLPVWDEVWNREFATARSQQRNKLIYLDSLGELNRRVPGGPPTLLYNPADETSVWRYWGPIVLPVPDPTAPRRSGQRILPDDIAGACGPPPEGVVLPVVDWDCVHLGPARPALGDWDAGWYWDIPHEHAAWYVGTPDSDGPPHYDRYDPDRHGAPTDRGTVADGGFLAYLPATVADGAGWADVHDAWKPYRPEGFPDDPDAYREMWRYDVGGGSWHKEMGQLVLLVPADELVAWLEANGYDPQRMFARGWPNPDEELLIRNTWGRDWDRDNPADWRNSLAGAVGWLQQGVEIGDSGNLAADIEAAIHISTWMDWAYRSRIRGSHFPVINPGQWWSLSVQDREGGTFAHRPDGWATRLGLWRGLYHQALADGYHPDAATGRLTHPALAPELAVWKEWAAAGEAEKWLGFQAADGDLGPAPGDTWIPWYPEGMVPLENHYLRPEGAVAHWESVVDWWPDGGLEPPVHLPDRSITFTVAGPYVAEAGGHLFETCLWATGGLFAAWSLPHPELEDASQNVTWIVRGIADRNGRVVKLAEPVNRPCINAISRWQHEGNIPNSHGGRPTFEEHLAFVRTPLPAVQGRACLRPGYRAVDHHRRLPGAGPVPAARRRHQRARSGVDRLGDRRSERRWDRTWHCCGAVVPRLATVGNRRARNRPRRPPGKGPAALTSPVRAVRMGTGPSGHCRECSDHVQQTTVGGVGHPRPVHRLAPKLSTHLARRVPAVHLPDRQPTPPAWGHALAVQRRNRHRRGHVGAARVRMGTVGRPPRSRNVARGGGDNPPVRPTPGNGPDHPRRPHRRAYRK